MRYVSAYLLAVLGGNANPKVILKRNWNILTFISIVFFQVDDLKNILSAVGVDADAETAKLVVSRLAGKTVEELIAEGSAGLVSVRIQPLWKFLEQCYEVLKKLTALVKFSDA